MVRLREGVKKWSGICGFAAKTLHFIIYEEKK
jgi:hypothetical protein